MYFCKRNIQIIQKVCDGEKKCEFFDGFFSEFIDKNTAQKYHIRTSHRCNPNENCIFEFTLEGFS